MDTPYVYLPAGVPWLNLLLLLSLPPSPPLFSLFYLKSYPTWTCWVFSGHNLKFRGRKGSNELKISFESIIFTLTKSQTTTEQNTNLIQNQNSEPILKIFKTRASVFFLSTNYSPFNITFSTNFSVILQRTAGNFLLIPFLQFYKRTKLKVPHA